MDPQKNEFVDWYEEDGDVEEGIPGSLPGLSLSWAQLLWSLASTVFALVWIGESVNAIDAARGYATYSSFAGHIWVLLLVMALCTLLLRLARPLKGRAYLLSGAAAVAILFTHTF